MSREDLVEEVKGKISVLKSLLERLPLTPAIRNRVQKVSQNVLDAILTFNKVKERKTKNDVQDDYDEVLDWIDNEGTQLWNAIKTIERSMASVDTRSKEDSIVIAQLRLTALRLVEAGMNGCDQPILQTRFLRLIGKIISSFVHAGEIGTAKAITEEGATYCENLENNPSLSVHDPLFRARQRAILSFYLGRIELLLSEGNVDFAFDRMIKACKLVAVSNFQEEEAPQRSSLMKDAITWFDQGLVLFTDDSNGGNRTSESRNLMIALLESAAQAHIVSGSLGDALRVLRRLDEVDQNGDSKDDVQLLRLEILNKKDVSDETFNDAIGDLIDHIRWGVEDDVESMLGHVRFAMSLRNPTVALSAMRRVVDRSILLADARKFLEKIIYSAIFALEERVTADPAAALHAAQAYLDSLSRQLPRGFRGDTLTVACQKKLWDYAAKINEDLPQAAEMYALVAHRAFAERGRKLMVIGTRKAALCHLKRADVAAAQQLMHGWPLDEAITHYVTFQIALKQGNEDDGVVAIEGMSKCQDLDWALVPDIVVHANRSNSPRVIIAALELQVLALDKGITYEPGLEFGTVFRLLIDFMAAELLRTSNPELVAKLVKALTKALKRINNDKTLSKESLKELSRLCLIAYNTAISVLDSLPPMDVSSLFNSSVQLMNLHAQRYAQDDPNTASYRPFAAFSCLWTKVSEYRQLPKGEEKSNLQRSLINYIGFCHEWISEHVPTAATGGDIAVRRLRDAVNLFQIELLCDEGAWQAVQEIVQELDVRSAEGMIVDPDFAVFQVVALVNDRKDCPEKVMLSALSLAISRSSAATDDNIINLSQWIHMALNILESSTEPDSHEMTFGLAGSALDIIMGQRQSVYPRGQVNRLAALAWKQTATYSDSSNPRDLETAVGWCQLCKNFGEYLKISPNKLQEIEDHLKYLEQAVQPNKPDYQPQSPLSPQQAFSNYQGPSRHVTDEDDEAEDLYDNHYHDH